ncbi:DEAD/DEAH box helicase family protein [Sporosarcina sp. FSL W7-1283]|uniref:DEAD/DEAH box helicase family protein n=1 Tax=Sporosarcina sp. FSL W7-1283 TaxID=2921560 RepID=UPI0030FA57EA
MSKVWVSDVVTREEIEKWNAGDIITIASGTGGGKSHFVKYSLHDYAKENDLKILMLIHRRSCVEQFLVELKKENIELEHLHIKTYQSLEARGRRKEDLMIDQYDIIVADEFHYFLSDSSYNHYCDISLEGILSQGEAIRIFMSATGDNMKYYLKNEKHKGLTTIDYTIPNSHKHIKRLEFFYKDETLETYIEDAINTGQKAIFFIQSAKKAYELHKKYKENTVFNCSKGNPYYKYVNEGLIKEILKKERFDEQILITTQAFDAGINLKDRSLHHIVVDVDDVGSLIQCIGRKRMQYEDDYIILHIKALSNKRLGGIYSSLVEKLEMPVEMYKNGDKSMIDKFYRSLTNSYMIYDTLDENGNIKKKLNEMMFFKTIADITEIKKIINKGRYGYCLYISKLLNSKYQIYEEEDSKMKLENYLEKITGHKLLKEDQIELIDQIDLRVNGRKQRSYKKLNEGLEMIKLKYMILPKRTNKERYWEVHKLEE